MEGFEIVTTLGRGSGGAVFLVKSKTQYNRLFALKKIQLDENKKTRKRDVVLKEASILAKLRHPNIVLYHQSFFEDSLEVVNLCIVQDYCDGGTLEDVCQQSKEKQRKLAEDKIMHYFVQVVLAVQYIHSQKILHRDLKTQNVFVTKMGLAKLGDFGIAKSLDQTLDKASTCVGTPCYLSPELCQDIPYNNKSDIWALGCLLYEMCAFQPAFDASNLISLFYKIVKCEHAEIPDEYSEQLVTLVKSILIKDPDLRPCANTLLSLPFVQQHLTVFIDGTEQVQNQMQRVKQEDINRHFDQNVAEISKAPLEPRESGEYSDDFSSSEEEDNEDNKELEEETFAECSESASNVNSCNNNHHEASKNVDDDNEVEYADDFEEDSDVDLEDVLCHAKTAVGIKASSQSFHDEEEDDDDDDSCQERPVSSCRNFIKEQCIENLGGVEVYEKWKRTCEDLRSDEKMQSSTSLEFEHVVGVGQRETCYLLSELLTASIPTQD